MYLLTSKQKEFIDSHFYEGLSENDLDKSIFECLSTSYELHYLVEHHNWDNGIKLLHWIAESRICSEATALQLFWLSQPQEFLKFKLTQQLENKFENDIFTLIKIILNNFPQKFYSQVNLSFDPLKEVHQEYFIPSFMKNASIGEEPYIYFDEMEVKGWFGDYLINKISRCDTTLELYNIAYFIKEPYTAQFILNHNLCDKAIALLLFWRLKTYANMWYETHSMKDDLIEKIRADFFPEVLYYDPKKDSNIVIKSPKAKWKIPNILKQKI